MQTTEAVLSIKDAAGRQINLLNDSHPPSANNVPIVGRRKYHCLEPGCNKSFTTSGHLARHNRIHTGEKNFQCLHPGCPSRFSRQDNMMQHYRTHLSPKSRKHHAQQQQQQQQQNHHQQQQQPLSSYALSNRKIGKGLVSTGLHPRSETMATIQTRTRRAMTLPSSFDPYPVRPYPSRCDNYSPLNNSCCSSPTSSPTLMEGGDFHYATHRITPETLTLPKPKAMEITNQPPRMVVRPQRALSTSSISSYSSSGSSFFPSPLLQAHAPTWPQQHQQQQDVPIYPSSMFKPSQPSPAPKHPSEFTPIPSIHDLLQLATVVSTFG
ncbi:uncharacterized protein BYT42DRAFT_641030 [Radiomyces spectabilis]|uniref:uncharacterized protein n=1 Tax=Radiomyces spectabilis TaxID=64574 RepID=UPI00221E917C|nr:uncharacterized protein BYT42DRAFT_641030 [Radiomyces spectabilis]KAI8393922.1 hypothetical protein BYT42DRAFT_641030 [Radiomyces spectabilis]